VRSREKYTQWVGVAILGLAVLGVGGAPRPVLAVLGALVAGGLALQVTSRRRARPSPLLFVLAAAVGLTLLQLVPLPVGLASGLDPVGQELRRDGELLVGEASSWVALSRDPASTGYGLAYLLILGGAALLALRVAASEQGRFAIVGAVGGVGAAAALVTGLHELVGATALYGVYQPDFATPVLLGPLLNPNHLGCLFAMSAVASGGLVFHARQPGWARAAWAGCATVTVAAALLTLSRGAALALLAGGLVMAATLVGQRMRGRDSTAAPPRLTVNALAIGVVAMCALALVVYTSGRGVSEQLRETTGSEWGHPGSKYTAWRSAGHLVAEVPWLGIGRGAFESSFTRIHPASGKVTFSHPENEYVQAVVEWGLPGALLLAALVGWVVVAAGRRWRMGAVTSAALGAAAVVAVQSVVDFGLELPGIGIPTVAILATLVHVPLRELSPAHRRRMMAVRVAAVVVALGASVALLVDATRRIADDHRVLVATRPSRFEVARPILERHPHDYLAFAAAGDALVRSKDPRAMSFLNHALRLHPTHPGTHRAAARLLLASGLPRQAALEYATAMRGAMVVLPMVKEAVRLFRDPELAAAAIPADYPVPEHIVRTLEEVGADQVAVRWLRTVAEQHPTAPRIGELLAKAAQKHGDLELAEMGARLAHQREDSATSLLALGQLLVKQGKLDEAASALVGASSASGSAERVSAVWLLSCDVDAARGQWVAAKTCLLALRTEQRNDALLLEIARRLERAERGIRGEPVD
jgi:O-antigen ligase